MKIIGILNLRFIMIAWLLIIGVARGQDDTVDVLETGQQAAWRAQTSVCYVESFGKKGKAGGTGVLAESYAKGLIILFTAKHVLEGQDSVQVTVLTYDINRGQESMKFTKRIEENASNMVYVPDTNQDCAALMISILDFDPRMVRKGYKHYVLPHSNCLSMEKLFPGIPVVIVGYALGLHTGPMLPLIRKGHIAGIDPESKTIYLDSQVFPGSSGSPVYLDVTKDLGRKLEQKHGGRFVGLVWGAIPFNKKYVNPSYPSDKLTMSENSGIGTVLPADVLMNFVDLVARVYNEFKEKQK